MLTSSATMTAMPSGVASLLEGVIGELPLPTHSRALSESLISFSGLDNDGVSMSFSPLGEVVFWSHGFAVCRLMSGLERLLGCWSCLAVAMEAICGGDRCLGHLSADC